MATRRLHELGAEGLGPHDVQRAAKDGTLARLRHGSYCDVGDVDGDARAAHWLRLEATRPLLGAGAVISHQSAALIHGIWLPDHLLGQVTITRQRSVGGHLTPWVHTYVCPFDASDVVQIDGMAVMTRARTALDLARTLSYLLGVGVVDAFLREGVTKDQLAQQVTAARRRPGNGKARSVVDFADPRSESMGESESRVLMARVRIPAPELQVEVYDASGRFVARSDFGWRKARLLGEFDGLVKYGRLLKPGQSPTDVVVEEKRREERLRRVGWDVVRFMQPDLRQPPQFRALIMDAYLAGVARVAREGRAT